MPDQPVGLSERSDHASRPEYIAEFLRVAEWDWLQFAHGSQLHALGYTLDIDSDGCWADGKAVCGRRGRLWVPGVLTRMSAQRCRRCCERTGMPEGKQSPKNDDTCQAVAEGRIAAWEARATEEVPF